MSDYSSNEDVVAFTRHLLDGTGTFNTSTRPTGTEVNRFLDRASGVINVALASAGFTVPVTQATAKLALDDWVTQRTAEYVELTQRGVGYGDGEGSRTAAFRNLAGDAAKFVETNFKGFANLGVPMAYGGKSAGLSYTGLDAQSQRADPDDSTLEQPLFSRRQWDDTSTTDFAVEDDEE